MTGLRRLAVGAVATGALAVLLAGCASGPRDAGAAVPLGSKTAAAPTSNAPSTSAAPADPRAAAVTSANATLTGSLYTLVETMKRVQADNDLSQVRQRLAAAATAARDMLQKQRTAAYPAETRNCTTVRSLAAQITTQIDAGNAARSEIARQVTTLRADVATIDAAVDAVTRARDAVAVALTGVTSPPATVSATEVAGALDGAAQRRKDVLDTVAAVSDASGTTGESLTNLAGQSRQIVGNACV